MEVSQAAIWDMEYRKVADVGTRHCLTAEEGDLGNGRNLKEMEALALGSPTLATQFLRPSLPFPTRSVCLGLQQKQSKENTSLAGDKPR